MSLKEKMQPVDSSDFQVLNCPANWQNKCQDEISDGKEYCYDAKFCPVKQQIIYNWAMLGIFKASPANRGFHDLPESNISLLMPYSRRIVDLKDMREIKEYKKDRQVEFKEKI